MLFIWLQLAGVSRADAQAKRATLESSSECRDRLDSHLRPLAAQLVYGLQNLLDAFVIQHDALLLAELVPGDHLRLDVSGLTNQNRQLRVALLDRLIELGYEVSVVR